MHPKLIARSRSFLALIVAYAVGLAPIGCRSTSLKEVTFKDQPSAGSVHVAVQSIAPFDEYIDSLQPRFELTSAQALDQAIPLIALREVQELRSLAANLKAAFPRLKAAEEGNYTRAPGETSDLAAPPEAQLPTQTPFALPAFGALQTDPTLRYHAAASLFQEVSLLSNYVRDAAVHRDQVPYIVRLLITSFPKARTGPYDFYATVSFFEEPNLPAPNLPAPPAVHGYKDWDEWTKFGAEEREEAQRDLQDQKSRANRAEIESLEKRIKAAESYELDIAKAKADLKQDLVRAPCGAKAVSVIPLFATESYEASLLSSAFASRRSFALSAGGTVGTVGLDAAGQSSAENRERTLVQSLNQPFSVARIAENSLQVRLGAVFSGTRTGFVTPARTYNLTALILVRRMDPPPSDFLEVVPCPSVRFRAHTEIRQVGHARSLARWPFVPELTRSLVASFPGDDDRARIARNAIESLTPALLGQDYNAFLLAASGLTPDLREEIWLHSQETMAAWGISVGRLQVPDRFFRFFDKSSKATLVDDGKAAVLKVTDIHSYVPANGLSAQLQVNRATFPADRIAVSADGKTAIVTFPSLKAECKTPNAKGDLPACEVSTDLSWRRPMFRWGNLGSSPWVRSFDSSNNLAIRYITEKPQSLAKPQLTVPASRIVLIPPDTATLSVIVRPARVKDEAGKEVLLPLALSMSGAEIVGVLGLPASPRFWTISSDSTLVLNLRNVVADGTIRIRAATLRPNGEIDEGAEVFQDLVVSQPLLPHEARGVGR